MPEEQDINEIQMFEEQEIGEVQMSEEQNVYEVQIQNHCAAITLDSAYNQYNIQWTRLASIQQSASSVIAFIAIIFGIMAATLTQKDLIALVFTALGVFKYSFLTSIIFSLIYLSISIFFVMKILLPKSIDILANPAQINKSLWNETKIQYDENKSYDGAISYSTNLLVYKIDDVTKIIEEILNQNQRSYFKSLISGTLSLSCTVLALLHILIVIFKGHGILITINSIACYILCIGILFIIFYEPKF